MKLSIVFSILIVTVLGRTGFGPTEQEWGYVTVREGAHLFWWLQQTSADVVSYTERPVVVWLQGGPGASSTGFGNFGELGPLDADLNPRETTWLNDVNVLFVDNPVGTGYSYVDSYDALATNNRQIAEDFLALLQGFYETLPELKSTPLYIFCESYGGKMTAEIALVVDQAIKDGTLDIQLPGVGLGDGWVSPIDSVLTWAPYLESVGAVDRNGYNSIEEVANQTRDAVEAGEWETATNLWSWTEGTVMDVTDNIDFYNILTKVGGFGRKPKSLKEKLLRPSVRDDVDAKIEVLMNNDVKEALGLDVTWGEQSGAVFSYLGGDFMKPVTDIVEELLNTTDIQVAVYNGQLDLIVDTPGTVAWVDRLKFPEAPQWPTATRSSLVVDGVIEGYVKRAGNLAMYWVDRSGHMVPSDNPAAMRQILADVTNNFGQK